MSGLKQKIILEGLFSWASVCAWMVGSTLLMAGWATSSAIVEFLGFILLGGGTAWSLTSLSLRFDSIKLKVMDEMKGAVRDERNRRLDELDAKLTLDKDPRDQEALRDLRLIHREFEEFADEGKIPEHVRDTMVDRINELFEACVKNLQICYDLWDTARSLRNSAKQKLLQNREAILQDVIHSVENFTNVVTSIMTMNVKNSELPDVNSKLDAELAACLRVEQRLRDLDNPAINDLGKEYERYAQ